MRLFGARPGLLAAVFVAFYPEFIWYCAHFWCETLFLTILWWGLERALAADASGRIRDAAGAGLLFGFAILTRETFLYLVPVVALWLWFRPSRDRALPLALVLTTFAVVAPWTARNAIQFGAFIPVSTGGGLNLYQGNAEVPRDQVYLEYYVNEGKVEQFEWARMAGLRAIWKRQPGWIFEKIRDEGPRLAELDSLALIHLRRGAYESVSCTAYRAVAAVVLLPWLLVAFGAVVGLARVRLDRAALLLIPVSYTHLTLPTIYSV